MATAILVDGGFYRKRASVIWGPKNAEERANELLSYCHCHIADNDAGKKRNLYRIFYYDCPPIDNIIFNPLTEKNVNLGKSETYKWTHAFLDALVHKRKVALRLGRLSDIATGYRLRHEAFKDICSKKRKVEDLTDKDLQIEITQKGVDMKLGLDILDLSYKHIVDQIILISGDSDFVPAAKMARREGVDFILDPMGGKVADDLMEHIDGLMSHWRDRRISGNH